MASLKFASSVRCLFSKSQKFSYSVMNPLHPGVCQNLCRHAIQYSYVCQRSLYTAEALGVDVFQKKRAEFQQLYSEDEADRFRATMRDNISRSHHTLMLVFKQDLEKAIFLCRNTEEDIQLVKELLLKYNDQNSKLRFGSFRFGAVLLRLFYELQRPDVAMELMDTPELNRLLSHVSTFQVLMTLLYEQELYPEVLDVMDSISTGRRTNGRYPRLCVILALAAALKQGTEQSLTRGLALAEACTVAGQWPSRFYGIAGTIALKAARPDIALKLLHNTEFAKHAPIRNILLLSWCQLGRLDQVLSLLRPLTADIRPGSLVYRPHVYRHTMDAARAAIEQQENASLKQEFERVERTLLSMSCVGDMDLADVVLSPLESSEIFISKRWASDGDRTSPPQRRDRENLMDESGW